MQGHFEPTTSRIFRTPALDVHHLRNRLLIEADTADEEHHEEGSPLVKPVHTELRLTCQNDGLEGIGHESLLDLGNRQESPT